VKYTAKFEARVRNAGATHLRMRFTRRKAILRMKMRGLDDAYGNEIAYRRGIRKLIGGIEYYSQQSFLISYLWHTDPHVAKVGTGFSLHYAVPETQVERTKWQIAYLVWLQDGSLDDNGEMDVMPHPHFDAIIQCMLPDLRERIIGQLELGATPCGAHGYYPARFHAGASKLKSALLKLSGV